MDEKERVGRKVRGSGVGGMREITDIRSREN